MESIQHLAMTGAPFIWDKYLPEGKIAQDMDGLWHVGEGTDLQILIFEVQLTAHDKKFLKSLRITTG